MLNCVGDDGLVVGEGDVFWCVCVFVIGCGRVYRGYAREIRAFF